MTRARGGRAGLACVVALTAAVLGHDVHRWQQALDRGDATFASEPERARWEADTWLPAGVGRALLGVDDDLALRRAEQAYRVARDAPRGLDNGARQARLRATAELALLDVVQSGSRAQAGREGTLLGILVATAETGADASVTDRRAADLFATAVRTDPGAVAAAYDLELLLRRIRVVGTREGPGTGSGNRGSSRRGAGSSAPGSGY